ncbi:hypothetical protein C0Q70_12128 [Pomacea canaliculata]|uniref:Immunoglobulin subtype domain-containing protein n=1 Tax=Pomacea canaliculata TaxID=400727 RepID=A0A2T7P0Q9_POMCA|nr:hypothetical protein C0Q70_12128 [Pomacea canaliculata]
MTTVEVFLLTAFVMTTFTESKTLAQAEKKTTCGIRGLGTSDMMLTCYFHHNISMNKALFGVFPPVEVVSCQWTPEVSCSVAPGYEYEYDGDVNRDHTNVRILKAATEHVGMYTCQKLDEEEEENSLHEHSGQAHGVLLYLLLMYMCVKTDALNARYNNGDKKKQRTAERPLYMKLLFGRHVKKWQLLYRELLSGRHVKKMAVVERLLYRQLLSGRHVVSD